MLQFWRFFIMRPKYEEIILLSSSRAFQFTPVRLPGKKVQNATMRNLLREKYKSKCTIYRSLRAENTVKLQRRDLLLTYLVAKAPGKKSPDSASRMRADINRDGRIEDTRGKPAPPSPLTLFPERGSRLCPPPYYWHPQFFRPSAVPVWSKARPIQFLCSRLETTA